MNFAGGQPPNPPAITEELLQRMGAPVAHRGPDGQGTYISPDGRVGLIHYRLSIVDLPGGAQPMCNEDGTIWVVFNGEIYNHVELRPELEKLGHRFKTDHADTEVIIHAYEQWGDECPKHFRGMFAFAIVDLAKKSVCLARDRLGQKPLYVAVQEDGALVFASNASCLGLFGLSHRRPASSTIAYYLLCGHGLVSAHNLLPVWPGHSFRWPRTGDGAAAERTGPLSVLHPELVLAELPTADQAIYWPDDPIRRFRGSLTAGIDATRKTLVEATELRLHADVEVGCFLSGGIDSAIVASIIRRVLNRPIRTFTIGTPDPAYDEREPARLVAKELGTEHVELEVQPEHLLDVLDDLIETVGEPFADSSIIPTYWVAKLTRQHVKVTLSGDGGDEAFCGYDRYRAVRLAARYHTFQWFWQLTGPLWRRLAGRGHRDRWTRLARLADGLAQGWPAAAYRRWVELFDERAVGRLMIGQDGAVQEAGQLWRGMADACFARCPGGAVQAASHFDYVSYLPGDILTKVDRASMRVALEVRSPFLDHKVVELAL
ncbi:MAG: asparagine synthase (glutamine-hydrolyzing), partial [Phycisphaerae bacterium]|nr:asparagine synthase (glutamine-hydrolyzing) [Phycisphaerae bacterium]